MKKHTTARKDIFGHSVTSVIRYLGRKGWDSDKTMTAVRKFGAKSISPITVRLQLKAGAEGERGAPAKLSKAEYQKLAAVAK